MYQTNKNWGDWGILNFHVEFTRALGGWVNIQATHQSSPGSGMKIVYADYLYEWKSPSGQTLYQSSSQQFSNISSATFPQAIWSNVLSNISPQSALLWVHANVQFIDANNPNLTETRGFSALTSIQFCEAPGQIVANTPDNAPIQSYANAYCGIDANGSNTRYEAVFSKPDESASYSMSAQSSNHFVTGDISYLKQNGNIKWKARAINDQGTGPWSSWNTFQCQEPITGSVNCSVDPMSSKPIHGISGSFSCSSGHTINSYSWTLKKNVGGSWQTVTTGTSSTFATTQSDNPAGIQYQLVLTVTGTKNGIQSQATFYGYCSYNGEYA